jgi:hypothetical protein
VNPFPYPTAAKNLTPKMVRDAFKRLEWTKLSWWSCESDSLRAALDGRKAYFRSLTIAQLAAPVAWSIVCAVWNSARMASVRESFDASLPDTFSTKAALDVLATMLVIYMGSQESPVHRLKRILDLVGVERTEKQEAAHQRAQVREQATMSAAEALRANARRSGDQVVLDCGVLFGTLLTQKAEFARFRCGKAVATVKRIRLDAVAKILETKVGVVAALAPMPDKAGRWALSIRWTNASGTVGGLDFSSVELDEIHDDWCTLVELPEDLLSTEQGSAVPRPEWASEKYISACLARQEAERKAREKAESDARMKEWMAQWGNKVVA